jgi:GAF domain-containing protein
VKRDATFELIAEEAKGVTGATGAAIGLKIGCEIVCHASTGTTAPDLGVKLDIQSGISGECIRTGRIVRCTDTTRDALVDAALCKDLGIGSIIAMPLYREKEVVGLIEISSTRTHAFDEEDICRLGHIADSIFCRPDAIADLGSHFGDSLPGPAGHRGGSGTQVDKPVLTVGCSPPSNATAGG